MFEFIAQQHAAYSAQALNNLFANKRENRDGNEARDARATRDLYTAFDVHFNGPWIAE